MLRKALVATIIATVSGVASIDAAQLNTRSSPPNAGLRATPVQSATCFFTHERSSGMNKICYYDCLGSPAAITVSAVQLCPLNIRR